jgi:aminocarboxymuconate-semialdehyde decarboxylase
MKTIDVHTHILPHDLPDLEEKYGYPGWVHLHHHAHDSAQMIRSGRMFREIDKNCWDELARIAECDRFDVDLQVLSTVPVMFGYWAPPAHALEVAQRLNDHIAQAVELYPERFLGIGTVPMQEPEMAAAELARCVTELGMPGVQIGSHVNGINLDDETFAPFWEKANALKASVMVHPWQMMGMDSMPNYWLPWLVAMPAETSRAMCSLMMGGTVEKYPDVRLLFAHGGGSFAGTLGRIDHGFNMRPDLCQTKTTTPPSVLAKRVWVDAITHDHRALALLIDVFGADRIALGSDYPFPLGELEPGTLIRASSYDEATKAQLLGGSALAWLGMA